MKVNKAEAAISRARGGPSSLLSSKPSPGSPILEVFVRPQEGGAGAGTQRFLHQAVSLRVPTMEEVG